MLWKPLKISEKPLRTFRAVASLSVTPLPFFGRREETPTPKTRFSIWTLLRTPGRFTIRPFSVLSKDEIGL